MSMSHMSKCVKSISQLGAPVVNVDQRNEDSKPIGGRRLSCMKSNAPTESDIQFLRKSYHRITAESVPSPVRPSPPRFQRSYLASRIEGAMSCVFNVRMDQSLLRSTLSRPQFYFNLAKS